MTRKCEKLITSISTKMARSRFECFEYPQPLKPRKRRNASPLQKQVDAIDISLAKKFSRWRRRSRLVSRKTEER